MLADKEIVEVLGRQPHRVTIYFNEKRVDDFYNQCIGGITEMTLHRKLISRIKGFLGIGSTEVGGDRETIVRRIVSPEAKAWLVECESDKSGRLVTLPGGALTEPK